MKRIIALLLTLILMLSVLPMASIAATRFTNTYTMMKPEDLSETNIAQRGTLGFWRQLNLKRQYVKTITFLGSTSSAPRQVYDFSDDMNMSVIGWYENGNMFVAADGKIALNETSSYLFAGMKNLTEINFNGVVDTSKVKYMDHLFQCCEKLEGIDLSGFNTSNVVDMTGMFYGCKQLEKLDVSGFDTSKVKSMRHMFTSCQKLENLDLSGFHTPALTDMKAMFDSCRNLEYVDMCNFNTAKVTDMSNLFGSCASLEVADLSSFDTAKTQYMYSMFNGCKSLTYLDISGFTTKQNPNLRQMFKNVGRLDTFLCTDENLLKAYRTQ